MWPRNRDLQVFVGDERTIASDVTNQSEMDPTTRRTHLLDVKIHHRFPRAIHNVSSPPGSEPDGEKPIGCDRVRHAGPDKVRNYTLQRLYAVGDGTSGGMS